MFGKYKKCIVCEKKVEKEKALKKYQNYFCSFICLKKYEELLKEAKKKSLDNCC